VTINYNPVPEKNPLLENKYSLEIARLPATKYFASRVTLPGVSLPALDRPTPFRTVPIPGSKLVYDQQFVVDFNVDVNLANWKEIFTWMRGLGMPDDNTQYRDLRNSGPGVSQNDGLLSSARLILYTNTFNPNVVIVFDDIFPTNLSSLQFQTTGSEVLSASATFAFSKFDIESEE
jgi:hypothetical protein